MRSQNEKVISIWNWYTLYSRTQDVTKKRDLELDTLGLTSQLLYGFLYVNSYLLYYFLYGNSGQDTSPPEFQNPYVQKKGILILILPSVIGKIHWDDFVKNFASVASKDSKQMISFKGSLQRQSIWINCSCQTWFLFLLCVFRMLLNML